jgi:hypothetical protein
MNEGLERHWLYEALKLCVTSVWQQTFIKRITKRNSSSAKENGPDGSLDLNQVRKNGISAEYVGKWQSQVLFILKLTSEDNWTLKKINNNLLYDL